eukprot:scaffold104343_cov21-Prasinocladus_malaysianus.AAC.1
MYIAQIYGNDSVKNVIFVLKTEKLDCTLHVRKKDWCFIQLESVVLYDTGVFDEHSANLWEFLRIVMYVLSTERYIFFSDHGWVVPSAGEAGFCRVNSGPGVVQARGKLAKQSHLERRRIAVQVAGDNQQGFRRSHERGR